MYTNATSHSVRVPISLGTRPRAAAKAQGQGPSVSTAVVLKTHILNTLLSRYWFADSCTVVDVGTSTCRCPTSDMRARQLCILGSCGAAVSGHMSVSNTSQSSSGPLLLQASPTATADTHAMRSLHARCSTPNSKPSRLTCSECAYAA